ncbi:AMSH-like protease [Larimichthys crocea]|uniref:Uncharacterized protein n=1 Tax=Larimichthys crocea TaxID=215358 RepID=A0ACD3RQZ5_LARCR|nr:AMSH-like protease [Larimichthys crocea]
MLCDITVTSQFGVLKWSETSSLLSGCSEAHAQLTPAPVTAEVVSHRRAEKISVSRSFQPFYSSFIHTCYQPSSGSGPVRRDPVMTTHCGPEPDNKPKKLAAEPDYTDVSLTAAERVRALGKMGCSVEINEDIAPRRYFRSGVEMERMAAVYLEEGSLENAFVLYTKFITLFVEKLPGHRDYQQCSIPEKQLIMKKLQEVAFPRKDELKKRLQEKYSREHSEYLRAQSRAAVVDGCGQQLQRLSLLDEDRRRFLLLEEERQRVAALRRMQIESEQFRYFEEQLRRQELANRRGEEAEQKTQNEFMLTHVVIPKQSAGPDFCDMENVEELFSFQDQQNLLTLGWIHVPTTSHRQYQHGRWRGGATGAEPQVEVRWEGRGFKDGGRVLRSQKMFEGSVTLQKTT